MITPSFLVSIGRYAMLSTFCFLFLLIFSCSSTETAQLNGLQVGSDFTIENIVDSGLIDYPMFITYDDQGRLFVFESTGINDMGTEVMLENPSYQIRLLEDTDDDGVFDQGSVFADKITFPMGGTFYNGSLYVAASPDYIKLTDTDGDGVSDQREVLLSGWVLNQNGAILSGPFMGPDGWMYFADARRSFDITSKEGNRFQGQGARIWRCLPDGSHLESMSGGGFDNAIEIIFMPSGETIGTMTYFTDPQNGQRDALMHWVEGGVYPKPHPTIQEDQLTLTGDLMPVMTTLPRVAPSGLLRMESSSWGSPYQGNLFSAEFNTGRIMRHQIEADGASYRTVDSVFLSATQPDIHPTDILEDENGDLLVVVTGGWFINGCPLSQVAKPEVPGGIYRIRKKRGNSSPKDGWGKQLDFASAEEADLIDWIQDVRPKVRKRALELFVDRGQNSIYPLVELLRDTSTVDRPALVFALHRIGGLEVAPILRQALLDVDRSVRIAAARSIGLARDSAALDVLGKVLMNDKDIGVKRQVATAIGQIGPSAGIPFLLRALDGVEDRFLEHAIIYAMIQIGDEALVRAALGHTSNGLRSGALMALDQMRPSPLKPNDVSPFLTASDPQLRKTGLWILSHRPEWSFLIEEFIQQNLATASPEEIKSVLQRFCGQPNIQAILLREFQKSKQIDLQEFILDILKECNTTQYSPDWEQAFLRILRGSQESLKTAVLDIAESRGLANGTSVLQGMVENEQEKLSLRLKALNAQLSTNQNLRMKIYDWMKAKYISEESPFVRQQILSLWQRAQLSPSQLKDLAETVIPLADEASISGLLACFKADTIESIGHALVEGLNQYTGSLMNISLTTLTATLHKYPSSVQMASEPIVAQLEKQHAERLGKLDEVQQGLMKGDIALGRKLFFGKALCGTCHEVGQEGGLFGPDLSNIGEIRSEHDILEAIMFPSVSFAREYETYEVQLKDQTLLGIVKEQTSTHLILAIGPGQEMILSIEDILNVEPHHQSLMPAGLDQSLTHKELSDLMAFLRALPYDINRLIELENAN